MSRINFMMLGFCLIFAHGVLAGEDKEHDRLVKEIMSKSGLVKQVSSIPDHIKGSLAQAQQQNGQLSQAQLTQLNGMMADAYNAKDLVASVENHIKHNLTSSDIRSILKWLNSGLGKKITRYEEESSSAEAAPKIMAIAVDLANQDPKRLNKVAKLDDAIKGTESTVTLIQGIQIAMTMGMMSGMPENQRMSLDQLTKRVSSSTEQLYNAYKPQVLASFLYSYRDLSGSEIEKYINFASTKSAIKYHAVSSDAYGVALRKAGEKFGKSMLLIKK